jgi:putative oligomerization/nucleic acid binding protein
MLARYLKAQLIVLVCGGLVGPIFLITYFVLPGLMGDQFSSVDSSIGTTIQQSTAWLLWVGAFITVMDVLVAVWLANRGAQSSAKMAALQQTGVLATAQIQGMGETGMRINDHPVVNLDLRITGPGVDFTDRKRVTVDFTKQAIVTARKLVALVDPTTREYEIDWQASALVAGVVPMQITSSEDHKTYDLTGQAGPLMEILQIYKASNLPMSGTVDIRNYPAVRQQIMAVVRRAAEAQPVAAAAGGAGAPAAPSTGQRLEELEKLHASGAISEAEYAAARQKIIADL